MTALAPHNPTRRDFATLTAGALVGTGLLASTWPFLASLGPPARTRIETVDVDLAGIAEGEMRWINWLGKPVVVIHRSGAQLEAIRTADPVPPFPDRFRRQKSPSVPPYTKNWHRSLIPAIMVFLGRCGWDPCLLLAGQSPPEVPFECPCCGSRFDLAGRHRAGPSLDLSIPPYRLVGQTRLVIGEDPSRDYRPLG